VSTLRALVVLFIFIGVPTGAAGGSTGCAGVVERPTSDPPGPVVDGTAFGASTGSRLYMVVVSPSECVPSTTNIMSLGGLSSYEGGSVLP